MAKTAELHTHSTYSDGQLSPRELVRLAKKRGVRHLAITDHDSVSGVREAVSEGKKLGVCVIPAVEIDCYEGEILAYFVDINNKRLRHVLKRKSLARQNNVKEFCKKLRKAGYSITFGLIKRTFPKRKGYINNFYLLQTLYKSGYGKPIVLAPKLWSNEETRPGKFKKITMEQAVRLVIKSGGVPVYAHPWLDGFEEAKVLIRQLAKKGLKGLEINNGDRPPLRTNSIIKEMKRLAKRHELVLTSGSDYHGPGIVKLMPGNHDLGRNNCDEKTVEQLRKLSRHH